MANSYAVMTAETAVKCSKEDYDKLMAQMEKEGNEESDSYDAGIDFKYYAGEGADGTLYIYGDEGSASPEDLSKEVLKMVGEIIAKAELPYLECGIAFYCDKARPGSAGGTAVRFYPDGELVFAKQLFERS